ncbi:MAG TPA: amidohydrolase family protein [Chitinophagales bacterium]|nr:amidohydrolase family protein [Chitinophagales bacterium]
MLKIDIHTHIIPEHLPKWSEKFLDNRYIHLDHYCPGCAKMMQGDKFFREVKSNCWDGNVRIEECDATNVNVQVLSAIPVMFHYWEKNAAYALETSRFQNDFIAEVVSRHPTRFIGLGTVPLQDPQLSIEEMERCVKELRLAGIEIGSHVNDWNLNAEELFPFFEAAEKLGAAIFVHPWDMMGKDKMNKYWLPWLVGMPAETSLAICSMIFGGIFEKLPNLKVAFAHGGGSFPSTIGRIEHGFNVRPDLVAVDNKVNPRTYLNKFYLDTLVHDDQMLNYLLDLFGPAQLALGSDYPFPLGEHHPGKLIESMPYDDSIKARLLHGTALEWLGLEKGQFE